jgi:hypothetical protein
VHSVGFLNFDAAGFLVGGWKAQLSEQRQQKPEQNQYRLKTEDEVVSRISSCLIGKYVLSWILIK